MFMKEYILNVDGKDILKLNPRLIEKQNLSEVQCQAIIELHRKKYGKIQQMKAMHPSDTEELRKIVGEITELEFKLQDAWGFDRNQLMHRFWELPHCTCPKLDNEDSYGTEYYIVVKSCPLHGE